MILNEREIRHKQVISIAKQMMTAARTAPKARGIDIIEVMAITDEHIKQLSEAMLEILTDKGEHRFERDGNNILQAECIILIGTKLKKMALDCGYCGYDTCAEKKKEVPCTMNSIDVGIAIGSACATAADCRVDTRVMYSAGKIAQKLGWLKNCTSVIAIPICASSKNPFFDRPQK